MKSELKVSSPTWRVTITIGLTVAVIVITAMFVFRDEFRIILLGASTVAGLVVLVAIRLWYRRMSYADQERQLALQIKRQELRRLTFEANRLELQARYLVINRTERAIYDDGDSVRIIEALPESAKVGLLPEPATPTRKLLAIPFVHLLIVGGTGSGKTTLMNHLIDNFPPDTRIYVLDPHAKFNRWSGRASIIGGGNNFKAVASTLDYVLDEMNKRYKGDEIYFQKLVVVVDEWLAVANHRDCPNAPDFFKEVGSQARKANIHLVLGSQSATVEDLNIKGSSHLRENFIQLFLEERSKTQNLGKLKWGSGDTELVELPGPYVASSTGLAKRLEINPDWQFVKDVEAGMSQNELIRQHFPGIRRSTAAEMVKAKKAKYGLD